jgi:hypothetical protein
MPSRISSVRRTFSTSEQPAAAARQPLSSVLRPIPQRGSQTGNVVGALHHGTGHTLLQNLGTTIRSARDHRPSHRQGFQARVAERVVDRGQNENIGRGKERAHIAQRSKKNYIGSLRASTSSASRDTQLGPGNAGLGQGRHGIAQALALPTCAGKRSDEPGLGQPEQLSRLALVRDS